MVIKYQNVRSEDLPQLVQYKCTILYRQLNACNKISRCGQKLWNFEMYVPACCAYKQAVKKGNMDNGIAAHTWNYDNSVDWDLKLSKHTYGRGSISRQSTSSKP